MDGHEHHRRRRRGRNYRRAGRERGQAGALSNTRVNDTKATFDGQGICTEVTPT
jgi:hypothetical protein